LTYRSCTRVGTLDEKKRHESNARAFEMATRVTQLARSGITRELLKVGTKVRVMGSLSRHSPYMCFFDSLEFADGRTVSVNSPAGPLRRRHRP